MRKIAQEVTKAIAEQGNAARDIIKAAQNTTRTASQVRKATAEQATSAAQITQAADSMRQGAATTSRALAEQASAADQIAKSASTPEHDDRQRQQGDERAGHRAPAGHHRHDSACGRNRTRRPGRWPNRRGR